MSDRRETALELDETIDRLIEEPERPYELEEGELAATARILRRTLPGFHPRFTFEEHLARRLAVMQRPAVEATADPTPIRPLTAAEAPHGAAERRRRGLVAGGAVAAASSLAIPIAGAAIVVWRRSRSSGGIL